MTSVCRMWYHVQESRVVLPKLLPPARIHDTPVNIVYGYPTRVEPPEDGAAYVEQLRETQEVDEFACRPTEQSSAKRKRNYDHRLQGFHH